MKLRSIGVLMCALIAHSSLVPSSLSAEVPKVTQKLERKNSRITFTVASPSMPFNGTFSDYAGELQLDPESLENSRVNLSLNMQSVRLPQDQVMQAIFVQSVLARLKSPMAGFRSTSITSLSKSRYQVDGILRFQNKEEKARIPVEVVSLSKNRSEFKVNFRDDLALPMPGQKGGNGGRVQGVAESKLVFVAG